MNDIQELQTDSSKSSSSSNSLSDSTGQHVSARFVIEDTRTDHDANSKFR